MLLRNQKLTTTPDITITLINSENKRSRVTLSPAATIQDLYNLIYGRRPEKFSAVSQEDYQRAINLSCQGVKLTSLNSTLRASNITSGSMIRETLKKWTRGINVDHNTLTVTDPIMLTPITDHPFLLDNCNHTLEKASLTEWINHRLSDGETPNCPCCRQEISDEQIDKLVPNRPAPPAPITAIFITAHGMFAIFPNLPGGDIPARVRFNFPPDGPSLDRDEDSDDIAPPAPQR